MTAPRLSLVIPCFNEDQVLPISMPPLLQAMKSLDFAYEVILVDNGSVDETLAAIEKLIGQFKEVRSVSCHPNRRYGGGVLVGYGKAQGEILAHMACDGQADEKSVVEILKVAAQFQPGTLVKAKRIFRDLALTKRIFSYGWRLVFWLYFGRLSPDPNGTPKAIFRRDFERMKLTCEEDFLESEIMVKAKYLCLQIIEIDSPFRNRVAGISKVSQSILTHIFQFLLKSLQFRFSKTLRVWKASIHDLH